MLDHKKSARFHLWHRAMESRPVSDHSTSYTHTQQMNGMFPNQGLVNPIWIQVDHLFTILSLWCPKWIEQIQTPGPCIFSECGRVSWQISRQVMLRTGMTNPPYIMQHLDSVTWWNPRKARRATCELNWINHLRPVLNKFGFNHQAFIDTLGIFSCHEMLGNATILRDPAINRSNTGENGGIIGFKTRILSLTEWQCWSWKGGTSRTKIESDVSPLKIQKHSLPTNMVKWQNQSRTMGTRWENNFGL